MHLPQNTKCCDVLGTIYNSIFPHTLAQDALNLPPPEKATTYEQAVAEIARKSVLLVRERQGVGGNTGEQNLIYST